MTFISHGYLSVDLFFILSGYLMAMTTGDKFKKINFSSYVTFMKKRFSRIYPLYFIILTVAFITIRRAHKGAYLISIFLINPMFFNKKLILDSFWSLCAEWALYLLFPFIMFFCLQIPRKIILFLLPIVATIFLIFIAHKLRGMGFVRTLNVIHLTGLLRCLADYLLGITVLWAPDKMKIALKNSYIQLLISLLIFAHLFFFYTDVQVVLLSALLILSISTGEGIVNKILSTPAIYYLGLISYSVYLIHHIFCYTSLKIDTDPTSTYGIILRFAALIVSILISTITYKYIELPALKFLKRKLNC